MKLNDNTSGNNRASSLIDALHAEGPSRDRADKMGLYGRLIGNWRMDAVVSATMARSIKVPAKSILAGFLRAAPFRMWILPGVFYGTTLRVYDPGIDAWHILWSDPLMQFYTRQIGRARGSDIVQEGKNDPGQKVRWSFVEITSDSFRWLGERSLDDGATWQLQAEFFARRSD